MTEWVMLTAGTTRVPKLVAHNVASLTAPIEPGTEAMVWGTFYDIRRYGGIHAVVGGGLLILSSADESVTDHLARFAKHGVTHISGTPSHWWRVLMGAAATLITPRYVRLSGEIAAKPCSTICAPRTRRRVSAMMADGGGRIVNVASIVGYPHPCVCRCPPSPRRFPARPRKAKRSLFTAGTRPTPRPRRWRCRSIRPSPTPSTARTTARRCSIWKSKDTATAGSAIPQRTSWSAASRRSKAVSNPCAWRPDRLRSITQC
jgi:hypothetical protein